MATKNNAKIPDLQTIRNLGLDPKTGLPVKLGLELDEALLDGIRRNIRITDRQQATRRYRWYNLPSTLTGDLLERILYYRGQGAFFYMKSNDEFYFLPYALSAPTGSTGIDVYGRFTGITPLAFNGTAQGTDKKEAPWIVGLTRKPVYGFPVDKADPNEACVLLHDYVKDMSQTTIPRQSLNEPIIKTMSECIPYMRTSLMLGTGVMGLRVNDADQEESVKIASKQFKNAALGGQAYIPVVGNLEFQELAAGALNKSQEYMLAFQSLDNYRLSLYGLDNGGVFEKQGTVLNSEEATNGGNTQLVYEDGLALRQQFCDLVNAIWDLGIWCEETTAQMPNDVIAEERDYGDDDNNMEANDATNV